MLVIGRGLMASPKMLMLDEPSAALAPKVVLEIFANINRIAKSGVTILVVEQNVRMALILAQYGYIIRDGVIMMQGEAKELLATQQSRNRSLVVQSLTPQKLSGIRQHIIGIRNNGI